MSVEEIANQIKAVPLQDGRRIIAIVGPPASGKSTLAAVLAKQIDNACVVPMDGFHRDNDDLERHGLLARKGAPETFDVEGFIQVVRSIRSNVEARFPTFDRTNDRVIPNGGQLTAADETILVEGNYLLLKDAPWDVLGQEWDFSVMIKVALPVLQERLVARWLEHDHTAQEALARAQSNDLPNAKLVLERSLPADVQFSPS